MRVVSKFRVCYETGSPLHIARLGWCKLGSWRGASGVRMGRRGRGRLEWEASMGADEHAIDAAVVSLSRDIGKCKER